MHAETQSAWRSTIMRGIVPLIVRVQERRARPVVVGCSTETGSDAGKVFLSVSSSGSDDAAALDHEACRHRQLPHGSPLRLARSFLNTLR